MPASCEAMPCTASTAPALPHSFIRPLAHGQVKCLRPPFTFNFLSTQNAIEEVAQRIASESGPAESQPEAHATAPRDAAAPHEGAAAAAAMDTSPGQPKAPAPADMHPTPSWALAAPTEPVPGGDGSQGGIDQERPPVEEDGL